MTATEFIKFLQSWWWLVGIVGGLVIAFYRYSVKIHKATEELKRVAAHDSDIDKIWLKTKLIEEDTAEMKKAMSEIKKAMDDHVIDQKKDISTIMNVLFSLLDFLKKEDGDTSDVSRAHEVLRRRTLEK